MEFVSKNSQQINELITVIVTVFEKNTYIQQKQANSLWIIGEIQKQFISSKELYTEFLKVPKTERTDTLYEIIFFLLDNPSIKKFIPESQQDELQLLIDNKSNIKIMMDMLLWTLDKNQDGIIVVDELKCCQWKSCFAWHKPK